MLYEYPAFFARFYDTIYKHLRNSADNQFFLNQINQSTGKILEIGAGTGRLFTEALENQADIYGIDISPAMIDVLHQKLSSENQKRVTVDNMINFKHERNYQLIIAPFRVFMHILGKENQIHALNNVYNHLETGGLFIFDVFVPNLEQIQNGLDMVKDFDDEYAPGKRLQRFVSTKPDLSKQLINITFLLKWDEDDGYKQEKWEVPLRFFFRYELEHLIERSNFKESYHIYGNWDQTELTAQSKEFIQICSKHEVV